VAATRSRLDEYPLTVSEGLEHVNAVSMALANFGHDARLTIDEATDTADLFTHISRGLDHWLWFVEAHAQSPK
jgi:starvation-inducible DNA-binding protein